jgi:hypothetical protein
VGERRSRVPCDPGPQPVHRASSNASTSCGQPRRSAIS